MMVSVAKQTYVEKAAPGGVEDLVSTLWIQQIPAGSAPYLQRNIPNGHAELLYRIGDTSQIVGQRTAPTVDTLVPGTRLVGARIRPAATSAAFGLRARELLNRTVEVGAAGVLEFRATLADSCSPEHALELLGG